MQGLSGLHPCPLWCGNGHLRPERWQTYSSCSEDSDPLQGSRAKLCSSRSSGGAVGTAMRQKGRSSQRHRPKVKGVQVYETVRSTADTHREKVEHIWNKVC